MTVIRVEQYILVIAGAIVLFVYVYSSNDLRSTVVAPYRAHSIPSLFFVANRDPL